MIANGNPVKKGDELCRLDSSKLEELGAQEEIKVNEARASFTQARLSRDVARIGLQEYRDGLIIKIAPSTGKVDQAAIRYTCPRP